jgi:hypothetical protein
VGLFSRAEEDGEVGQDSGIEAEEDGHSAVARDGAGGRLESVVEKGVIFVIMLMNEAFWYRQISGRMIAGL